MKIFLAAIVVLVLMGIGIGIYVHYHPRAGSQAGQAIDPLCSYVNNSQLRCVVILGSDSLLGPGALVDYPTTATAQTPVPLPAAELFSSSCLVPGEKADALQTSFKQQEQENSVSVPEESYDFSRAFKVGIDLPVPRLYNLNLKAGPNINQLQKITFHANHAWIKYIDENVLLDLLASAGIKQSCIDHLLQSRYSVVSKALIAKDLSYEFTDKSGQSYSFSAAAQKQQLQFSAGGSTNVDANQATKILASTPVVLGVSFLNPNILQQQRTRLEAPAVFSSSGQAEVLATGAGGQGVLRQAGDRKSEGIVAVASAAGSEQSECGAQQETTTSMANLSAHVRTPSPNAIAISGTGTIRGGHYATGACVVPGQLLGLSGHDNGVTGQYTFTGLTRATIRSDNATILTVDYAGLPNESTIEVHDPFGHALAADDNPQTAAKLSGSGRLRYRIHGAGVYLVSLLSKVTAVVSGAGTKPISADGNISVNVQ